MIFKTYTSLYEVAIFNQQCVQHINSFYTHNNVRKKICPRSTLLDVRPHDFTSSGFVDWPFMTVHSWGENPIGKPVFHLHHQCFVTSQSSNYPFRRVEINHLQQCLFKMVVRRKVFQVVSGFAWGWIWSQHQRIQAKTKRIEAVGIEEAARTRRTTPEEG